MARTFTKNLANHLSLGVNTLGTILNGASSALVMLQIRPSSYDTSTGDNQLVFIPIMGGGTLGLGININGLGGANVLRLAGRSDASDILHEDIGNTAVTVSNWHTVAGLFNYATDQTQVYIDGSTDGPFAPEDFATSTYVNATPTSPDRIGRTNNAQTNQQFSGDIEYFGLWLNPSDPGSIVSVVHGGAHPFDQNPDFLMVFGYDTPDVDLMGSGTQGVITGSLPFVEGPTGLPPEVDHRRLIVGGLGVVNTPIESIVQDADFAPTTIVPATTSGQPGGTNVTAFMGHRIIAAIETQDYATTLSDERAWASGIASYKGDVVGGGTSPEPVISSVLIVETTEGATFFYQIDANNNPNAYSASPLPAGLVGPDENGIITGNADIGTADTYNVLLGAENDSGTGTATLVLTVHPADLPPPGGVFKHKPLPTAIMSTLGNVYAASTKF